MATVNDFGIPGVGSGILQPKQKHKWRVTFAGLGGATNSQPLSIQAITVTRPSVTIEPIQLDRYNSKDFVGGKHTWDDMTLVVEDDVTGTATQVIQEQLQKQIWLIGAEGPWLSSAGEGSLYKFVTYLDMLDGKEQVIEKWIVEGCWFTGVNYGDLDYASADKVTISLTIKYAHARQTIGGYNQGQGIATGGAAQ